MMKHSYLAILLFVGFLIIGSQHSFAKTKPSSEQQLASAYSETDLPAMQLEIVQPVAVPTETEPDSTQQSGPVGTMFQQVVDWLYPRQDTTKNRQGEQ